MGLKGGGKGWCGDCLKAEELKKKGYFRNEQGHLCFLCCSCSLAVRVRKEDKKKGMKGTDHLFEKHLCQECFDLSHFKSNQDLA